MQGLLRLTASFCLACICSELVFLMTDRGWVRRCIKSVAGLYILVVFFSVVGGVSSGLVQLEIPQLPQLDFEEESESYVLSGAKAELDQTLSEQCRQKFGMAIQLRTQLQMEEDGEVVLQAEVIFPGGTEDEARRQILAWLEQELGVAPDWREEALP